MSIASRRDVARVGLIGALAAWVIVVASEVSPRDATTIVVVLALQTLTGVTIVRWVGAGRGSSALELVAVGAPLGFVLSLVADQIVLATRGERWGWLAPIVLAGSTLLRPGSRRRARGTQDDAHSLADAAPHVSMARGDLLAGFSIVAAALLVLGGGWYWSSVVGVAVAASGAFVVVGATTVPSRRARSSIGVLVVVGAASVAIATRPATWWIEDSDYGFFEALGVSASRWGAGENALAIGYPIRYHWFVYGWTGMVDRIVGAPPWIVLSRAGLVVGALLVTTQLWCLVRRLGLRPAAAASTLIGLALFDTFDSWGSGFRLGITSTPSHLFGFVWLCAVVLWWLEARRGALTPLSALVGLSLLVGATGAKVSHGVAGATFVAVGTLADVVRRRTSVGRGVAILSGCGAGVLAVYVVVFRGAGNLGRAWLLFPVSLQGELVDYPGWPTRAAALVMLWGFAGAAAWALAVAAGARRGDPSLVWAAVGTLVVGGTLAAGTVSVFGSQLYFLHSALWLALPVAVAGVWRTAAEDPARGRGVALAVLGAAASCAVYRAMPEPASGSLWAISARLVAPAAGAVAIAVVLGARVIRVGSSRARLGWVLAAALLLHGVGVGVINWVDGIRREYPGFAREQDGRVGSADLQSAARWIDAELPDDAVLGSDDERPLVVALARRRMLVQTEWLIARHTRETPERDAEFEDRKVLQRDFAAAPTEALRERIVAKGADWFLVRLEPGEEWTSDVGTVRYRNGGYVVVELTAP